MSSTFNPADLVTPKTAIAAVILIAGIYALYKFNQGINAATSAFPKLAGDIGDKLNPASTGNIIYDTLIGGVGRSISGDKDWSLGSWTYDVFNPVPTGGATGGW